MKNLLDELNNLGEFEYSVSPEFSKNVMKKIRSKKRMSKIKYVVSIASAACVLGICVFVANNSWKSSSIKANSSFDNLVASDFMAREDSDIEEEMENIKNEVVTEASLSAESYNDSFDKITFDTDELKAKSRGESTEEDGIPNKEFIKTFSYQEYLDDIIKTLSENDFVAKQKDESIIVDSVDINTVSKLLENYTQIDILLESGQILIKIKK